MQYRKKNARTDPERCNQFRSRPTLRETIGKGAAVLGALGLVALGPAGCDSEKTHSVKKDETASAKPTAKASTSSPGTDRVVEEAEIPPGLEFVHEEARYGRTGKVQLIALVGAGCSANLVCDGKVLQTHTMTTPVIVVDKDGGISTSDAGVELYVPSDIFVAITDKKDCTMRMECISGKVKHGYNVPVTLYADGRVVVSSKIGVPSGILYQDVDSGKND